MAPCKRFTAFFKASILLIAFTSAEEEINETVICTKDLIGLEIPSTFFLTKSPPIFIWDLHLNDPECRGTERGGAYIFSIKTNFTDCGTIVASDGSYIVFTNTIQSNSSSVVTRSYINITFACRYPISYMAQQPNGENRISIDIRTITLSTEDGNFSVSLMLYKDKNFEDMWTTVPFLTLQDNIFVRVIMVPGHLIIRLEKCWATPTNDPSHAIQYTFIEDGCSKVSLGETLSIIVNGVAPEAMFRIQMFKFVGPSYNDVFLHCTVQICYNTEAVCKPNCTDYGRVTRTRRGTGPTHTVSYGPIRRKSSENEEDLNAGNLLPVEGIVLGGILPAVLVIAALFGKLLLLKRRRAYPIQAQLTLSNIHRSEVAS